MSIQAEAVEGTLKMKVCEQARVLAWAAVTRYYNLGDFNTEHFFLKCEG